MLLTAQLFGPKVVVYVLNQKFIAMKRAKNKAKIATGARIKLQVDYRTIITVRTQEALDMWMEKYPSAKIIES